MTKKIKQYNATRIKSRNFFSNISYNGFKEEDLFDKNFVFDVCKLITKSINPFSLERKIYNAKNREMISKFWEECNEPSFYKHICRPEYFFYLNGKNVIYPGVAEIMWKYIEENKENFHKIKQKLIDNKKIFQFAYATTYPEIYTFVEKRGIDLRNNFHLKFKEWKDKKNSSKTEECFSKEKPPTEAIQKELVTDQDFENEKLLADEQKQKEMEE